MKTDEIWIGGVLVGFQWEHIWFVRIGSFSEEPLRGLYRTAYERAGGLSIIERIDNDKSPYFGEVGPDDLVAYWDTQIKDLVNM